MSETITINRERMTLDLLLWQRFGGSGASLLEQALELNPGLAEHGVFIAIGSAVTLPELTNAALEKPVKVVSLFS